MSAPAGWDVPAEIGLIVELHSLSRDDLNGQRGECAVWDGAKERWSVRLAGGKFVSVRPMNLRRAPPVSADARETAFSKASEASELLYQIRTGSPNDGPLFAQVARLLAEAEAIDAANLSAAMTRGDLACMRGDYVAQAAHTRRAIANGHGMSGDDGVNRQNQRRVALAGALGNLGDLEGEVEQLRLVVKTEPGHIHARLSLGQNLLQRKQHIDAVPELLMALQLPGDSKPPMPAKMRETMRAQARELLSSAYGLAAQALAAKGEHAEAIATAKRILQTPNMPSDVRATAETNCATSHTALREYALADAALERARAFEGLDPHTEAFVLTTCGHCKENEGDRAIADRGGGEPDEAELALYAAAKALYARANALCEDATSRRGHTRVQAKVHPGIEWVPLPVTGAMGDGLLAGAAQCKGEEVELEQLPPGPSPPWPRNDPRFEERDT